MSDWKNFEVIDWADEKIKQYHIDTRDFHIATNEEEYKDTGQRSRPTPLPDVRRLKKYGNDFFYTADEVKALIKRYFKESGGVQEWRFFMLKGRKEMANWSMKYIRIYRVAEGLIVCNSDNYALRKSITKEEATDYQGQ